MRACISTLLIFGMITFTGNLKAQKKNNQALDALLQTEFIQKFREMRSDIISSAKAFKSQQNNYSSEDIQRVEIAYNKVSEKFNFVLFDLKRDLLDKKKLKYITKYPEDYQKKLEYEVSQLSEFYAVNYQQVLAEVTNNEIDGVAFLAIVEGLFYTTGGIFQLVRGISNYFSYRKKAARSFTEKELQKKLIEPHQLPKWTALNEQMNNYDSYDRSDSYMQEEQMPQDDINLPQRPQSDFDDGNRMKDKDGDGIADTEDRCPNEYGSREAMGCPDTDQDGIADQFDQCKYEYGYAPTGCPNADSVESINIDTNSESNSINTEEPDGATSKSIKKDTGNIKIAIPVKKKKQEKKKKHN